jgi:hypothetical protein
MQLEANEFVRLVAASCRIIKIEMLLQLSV